MFGKGVPVWRIMLHTQLPCCPIIGNFWPWALEFFQLSGNVMSVYATTLGSIAEPDSVTVFLVEACQQQLSLMMAAKDNGATHVLW